MSTRRWHLSALAAVAALVVAGCGGGSSDAPVASRVIAFGDSLSDIGAYTPATQIPLGQAAGVPPFFGGKFTTNSHTGYTATSNSSTSNVWVEWIAARVGVPITPHEVGFGPTPNRVKCPVATSNPALAGSCTGYAQGGSRVTSPAGIGNPNGNGINGVSPAPMTIPMVQQVADHHTRFNGFNSGDLVFVFGGNNDTFVQFSLVGAGAITPTQATTAVQAAATELAALVRTQILDRGATRVAVMTLPDASVAPGFSGLDANSRGLLSALSAAFNTTLLAALDGSGARIIDVRALNAAVMASPSTYGLTNVTQSACDPARVSAVSGGRITDGSSLFCNGAPASAFVSPVPNLNTIRTGASTSTWLFADSVHPTSGGHRILADQVLTAIKGFGWVPDNL
jgi:outer membrane lipase/esterase